MSEMIDGECSFSANDRCSLSVLIAFLVGFDFANTHNHTHTLFVALSVPFKAFVCGFPIHLLPNEMVTRRDERRGQYKHKLLRSAVEILLQRWRALATLGRAREGGAAVANQITRRGGQQWTLARPQTHAAKL